MGAAMIPTTTTSISKVIPASTAMIASASASQERYGQSQSKRTVSDSAQKFGKNLSLKGIVASLKEEYPNSDKLVVIGIDFGTTHSSVAWATIADCESGQINLITSWLENGPEEEKVPTEVCYENENFTWGYNIPPNADSIRRFKLLLLREEDLAFVSKESRTISKGRTMLRKYDKTATDLVGDYLGALWKHTVKTIYKACGQSVAEAMTFHVVITVPAIWKDYVRRDMMEAATKAGIFSTRLGGPTTLAFASKPEAAELTKLYEWGRNFDVGNVFVICDAGGGTFVSYTEDITQALSALGSDFKVSDVDPITLSEAASGIGGDVIVDEAFESRPKQRLGREWTRPVSEIGSLIDIRIRQINGKQLSVKGIILVGELGSSPHLYDCLKEKYAGQKIDVVQSTGIRQPTAICCGAILKGFFEADVDS